MKIGIDIHGTADAFPAFFVELAHLFVQAGHEVHIITGQSFDGAKEILSNIGIKYTHFFSIADYHEERGTKIRYDDPDNPWMDEETWNKTKAEYAKRVGLDMMFEDSDKFWPHFPPEIGYLKVMSHAK